MGESVNRTRVAIVDYGMGNLRSVEKAFARVGHPAAITSDPADIADATHVVLPGVGSFPACMSNLENRGLAEPVLRAIEAGKPFLGLCVGMQILFSEGRSLGAIRGSAFSPDASRDSRSRWGSEASRFLTWGGTP